MKRPFSSQSLRTSVFSAAIGHLVACLLLSMVFLSACKESRQAKITAAPSPVQQKKTPGDEPTESIISACTLITPDEVAAIQKATITDAKTSSGPSGNLVMSQCYYTAKEPNMAVSLAVLEPAQQSPTGAEAREYWENSIRGAGENHGGEREQNDKREGRAGSGEEKELKSEPKKIDGVGDEAYWSGNRFGGALYVLRRNLIIRVSVGGPDNEAVKIDKSKRLVEKALSRL